MNRSDVIPPIVRYAGGSLAIGAGLIHLAVTPEHFGEALAFGLFMLIVGLAQITAGVLLISLPSQALVFATALGTVAVFGVFAVAYTVGLPVGPHPGEREELSPAVVFSKIVELALLVVLTASLLGGRRLDSRRHALSP